MRNKKTVLWENLHLMGGHIQAAK